MRLIATSPRKVAPKVTKVAIQSPLYRSTLQPVVCSYIATRSRDSCSGIPGAAYFASCERPSSDSPSALQALMKSTVARALSLGLRKASTLAAAPCFHWAHALAAARCLHRAHATYPASPPLDPYPMGSSKAHSACFGGDSSHMADPDGQDCLRSRTGNYRPLLVCSPLKDIHT